MSITSLGITRAASYWYPTMLAQEAGELSESKAAELLGMGIEEYRTRKYDAIQAVITLIHSLPSPIVSLYQVLKHDSDGDLYKDVFIKTCGA